MPHRLKLTHMVHRGPGSVVGIATCYGLDGLGIESRWGARFSAPVQTGPGAHPSSCTVGAVAFPGGKERPGRDADPSPPSSAVSQDRVELYSPYGPYGLYRASVPVQGCTLPTFLHYTSRKHFQLSCRKYINHYHCSDNKARDAGGTVVVGFLLFMLQIR